MIHNINIHKVSSSLAILTFGLFIGIKLYQAEAIILSDAIVLGLTAGMLPVAIFLIVFPFKSEIKSDELKKMGLQITVGGLVLLFTYSKTIIDLFAGSG